LCICDVAVRRKRRRMSKRAPDQRSGTGQSYLLQRLRTAVAVAVMTIARQVLIPPHLYLGMIIEYGMKAHES
jgi:hypothetical protein